MKPPEESLKGRVTPHPDISTEAVIAGTKAVMNFTILVGDPTLSELTAVCLSGALPELKKTLGVKP